jgi:diguanylate cyclase
MKETVIGEGSWHLKFAWRIVVSVIVFMTIYFIFTYIFSPSGHPLVGGWELSIEGKRKSVSVPFNINVKHPQIMIFTTKLQGEWGDTLVIPEVNGGGLEVYLNGKKIYQIGNMKNGAANIWNKVHVVSISPYLQPEENSLKIRLFALYNGGITEIPYVGWFNQIERKILFTKFFKSKINLIIMGMALTIGVILISLTFMDKRNRKRYFVIGMSSLFMTVYLNDLQYWSVQSGLTYIILRKLFVISLYMFVFLFFDGMERNLFHDLKLSKLFLVITLLVSLYVAVQPTVFQFRKSLMIGDFICMILLTLTAVEVYWRKNYELIYPVTLTLEIAIYMIVRILQGKSGAFLVPYAALSLISGLGITLVKDYSRTYSNMLISHKASLTDPLTGVFNRNVLKDLTLSSQDIAMMVDMDGFKKVNDKYGHEKGDEILKLFCEKSEENLRNGDFIVRYGGDEFLLILRNCSKKNAVLIGERIRKSFEEEVSKYGVTFSYGVERIEKSLDLAIKKADVKMYSMKESIKTSKKGEEIG